MSVSIHTPLPTYSVFPSFDSSLSPPPTPIAKRARHFFPANASQVPMFFPNNASLLSHGSSSFNNNPSSSSSPSPAAAARVGSSPARLPLLHDRSHAAPSSPTFEKENTERQVLKDMARRPPPALRLRPRPLGATCNTKKVVDKVDEVDMDRIPSLPLWSSSDEDGTPRSYRSVPTPTTTATDAKPKVESKAEPKEDGEVVILNKPCILKKSTSAVDQHVKRPTFQRRGVRHVVTKRNSFAARSA